MGEVGKEFHERYRREGDHVCLDLRLRSPRQLFDSRDPAPFRDRDLDPEAETYILEALEELPHQATVKLVVHFAEAEEPGLGPAEVGEAIRAHMVHEEEEAGRRLRRFMRQAQIGALAAILVLLGCLFLSGWLHRRMPAGDFREAVREGLVILGWVALWRPLESFLYDWVPYRSRRREFRRLAEAPIEVRFPPKA